MANSPYDEIAPGARRHAYSALFGNLNEAIRRVVTDHNMLVETGAVPGPSIKTYPNVSDPKSLGRFVDTFRKAGRGSVLLEDPAIEDLLKKYNFDKKLCPPEVH